MKQRFTFLFFLSSLFTTLHASNFGLGIQTPIDFEKGRFLTPRLDYLHQTDSATAQGTISAIDASATMDSFGLGCDLNYFINGRTPTGVYLTGGVGVAYANLKVSASSIQSSVSTSDHQWILYPEIGFGYRFPRFVSIELLYKAMNYHDVDVNIDQTIVRYSFSGNLQMGLAFSF